MAEASGKLLHELLGWRGPLTRRQMLVWEWWKVGVDECVQMTPQEVEVRAQSRWFGALLACDGVKEIKNIEESEWHRQRNSKPS